MSQPSSTTPPEGGSATAGGESAGKTFTKDDVDRIVADRVARVERKYADHAELTTEVERLREQVAGHDSLIKRAEKAEAERDDIRAEASRDKISRAVTLEAIRAGAKNPELVASLVPSDAIKLEGAEVKGASAAIKSLTESDAYLFNAGSTPAGDGGARGSSTPPPGGDDMNRILRRAGGYTN